jgi:hypothetical protein
MDLTDPIELALEIADALRRERIDHALHGGLLLAAYGNAHWTSRTPRRAMMRSRSA